MTPAIPSPTIVLQVAFVQSNYNVEENLGPHEVCVVVTANQLTPEQTATVFISSNDLTAIRELNLCTRTQLPVKLVQSTEQ